MKKDITPSELAREIEDCTYCKSVKVVQYIDQPAFIYIVDLTIWTKIKCLISKRYYRALQNEIELKMSKAIIEGIEYFQIFKL